LSSKPQKPLELLLEIRKGNQILSTKEYDLFLFAALLMPFMKASQPLIREKDLLQARKKGFKDSSLELSTQGWMLQLLFLQGVKDELRLNLAPQGYSAYLQNLLQKES